MTRILLTSLVDAAGGAVPGDAILKAVASRARTTGDTVTGNASVMVRITEGVPESPIDLEATGLDWGWSLTLTYSTGQRVTRYVSVPATGPVEWADLVDVDPATHQPDTGTVAAWEAAVGEVVALTATVTGASVEAAAAKDAALVARDRTVAAEGVVVAAGGAAAAAESAAVAAAEQARFYASDAALVQDAAIAQHLGEEGSAARAQLTAAVVTLAPGTDAATKSMYDVIVCLGDSFTSGGQDGSGVTYASQLAVGLPNAQVVRIGTAGATPSELAIRAGAVDVVLAGFSLPAAVTPVAVTPTSPNPVHWRQTQTYAGVLRVGSAVYPGTLTETVTDGAAVFTFARTTAGAVAAVPAGAVFHCTQADALLDKTWIIAMGRNSLLETPNLIVPAYEAVVAHLAPTVKRYLVCSVPTRTTEGTGTTTYNAAVAKNTELSQRFGAHYVDFRRFLISDGLTVNAMAPDTADLAALAVDAYPPSLSHDGLHPNRYGYRAIGVCFHRALMSREWARQATTIPPLPLAPATVLASDSFDRADTTVLAGTSTDSAGGGTARAYEASNTQILSGRLTGGAAAGTARVNVGATSHRIEATIHGAFGIGFMVGFIGTSDYYYAIPSATGVEVAVRAGAVNTTLGTIPATLALGDTVGFARVGHTLVVYKGTVELGRFTDSTLTTGTRAGVRTTAGGTVSAIDDMTIRVY